MTRTRPALWALAALILASTSWSHAQPPPSANELVVEASRLIRSAESVATPEQTISLLEEAHRKLELIIEVHPSSDMAVRLATGQGIGTVSLAGVQAAIKAATEKCWTSLSLVCVAHLTLGAVRSQEEFILAPVDEFIAVASAQMKMGAVENSRATFKLATDTAVSEGEEGEYYLVKIPEAQAAVGLFGDAVKTTELIEDANLRAHALLAIAAAQSQAGQFSDAVKTSQLIEEDSYSHREALLAIAIAQRQAGQFNDAIETVTLLKKGVFGRTQALLAIAAAQRRAGQAEDAQLLIEKLLAEATATDASIRVEVLDRVASAQAEAGQFDAAVKTAMSLKDARKTHGYASRRRCDTAQSRKRRRRPNDRQPCSRSGPGNSKPVRASACTQ